MNAGIRAGANRASAAVDALGPVAGTYLLILALRSPTTIDVGGLGPIDFGSPFYLYAGSAFGPGGLRARVGRHLRIAGRSHWHVDYLRQAAEPRRVWYSTVDVRLECAWADAASALPGVSPVPRFGASDCRCRSHLFAAARLPGIAEFRRRLEASWTASIRSAFGPSATVRLFELRL